MIGAIIGDIAGSRFEFKNYRKKDFELFAEGCAVTDDSIMTLAIAKAIMEASKAKPQSTHRYETGFHTLISDLTVKHMREIGQKHPNCGFGNRFYQWVFRENPEPYNSFGNGAAMRISPVGFFAKSEWEAERLAEAVTAVTHNHVEGIKGATATAVAVYLARQGATKSEIRDCIVDGYYPLDFTIDAIRPTYRFNETCQETVPQAIACFLESISFEDAIRTAISLGGDSDTIGAITGAIAEAYYGVPQEIKEKALTYLNEELQGIYKDWEVFAPSCNEQYRVLTKYIGRLSNRTMIGGHPIEYKEVFPFSEYESEWMNSVFSQPEYRELLAEMGIEPSFVQITQKTVDSLDAEQVLALITAAFHDDHFGNGMNFKYFESGAMQKWLKRLKDIDWQIHLRKIIEVQLDLRGMDGYDTHRILITDESATFSLESFHDFEAGRFIEGKESVVAIRRALDEMHFEYWLSGYPQESEMRILDGERWNLTVTYDDNTTIEISGDNTYPENWEALLEFFEINLDYDEDEDARKPGEVIYCSVSFDSGKRYYYTTEDESIQVGDEVVVSVGTENDERIGTVKGIQYYPINNVPFPLERTKAIKGKAVEIIDDGNDGLKEF